VHGAARDRVDVLPDLALEFGAGFQQRQVEHEIRILQIPCDLLRCLLGQRAVGAFFGKRWRQVDQLAYLVVGRANAQRAKGRRYDGVEQQGGAIWLHGDGWQCAATGPSRWHAPRHLTRRSACAASRLASGNKKQAKKSAPSGALQFGSRLRSFGSTNDFCKTWCLLEYSPVRVPFL
jgi:hypothetical protein